MTDNHEKFLDLLFELDKHSLDSHFKNEELVYVRKSVNEIVRKRMKNELDFKLTKEDGDVEIAPGSYFVLQISFFYNGHFHHH